MWCARGDGLSFFSKEEYVRRIEKAKNLMAEDGIDALLVSSWENTAYFSGMRGNDLTYAEDMRSPLPQFVIIPKDGDPATVIHNLFSEMARQVKSIEDVRFYIETPEGEKPKFVKIIKDVFKERKLLGCKVGVELGFEQMMGCTYLEYQAIVKGLRPTKFVDASKILNKLRMIKSAEEINCLRHA
jgi:Xaa-Pro aminopeptidase